MGSLKVQARKIFSDLNEKHFEGKLPMPDIELLIEDEPKGILCFKPPKLILSKPYLLRHPEMFEQLILHEMIHLYLFLNGEGKREASTYLLGHSPKFKRLAKKFDLKLFS